MILPDKKWNADIHENRSVYDSESPVTPVD